MIEPESIDKQFKEKGIFDITKQKHGKEGGKVIVVVVNHTVVVPQRASKFYNKMVYNK